MAGSCLSLSALLDESGIQHNSGAGAKFQAYLALLKKWNATINLTANTEWPAICPLFMESIRASALYPSKAQTHLDIGSGGGFPAIPIRILQEEMKLDIVESRGKRCVFLESVVNALEIHETTIHNMRLNEFLDSVEEDKTWDCISWKAIRLTGGDLEMLRKHAHERTQFWIFHGKELAVRDPVQFSKDFRLLRQQSLIKERDWNLSIYSIS